MDTSIHKQLDWQTVVDIYCHGEGPRGIKESRLIEDLHSRANIYNPDKFILIQCIVMDSSHCGEVLILPVGGSATLKEIPTETFSPRGLASDISEVIGWFKPEDIPCPNQ